MSCGSPGTGVGMALTSKPVWSEGMFVRPQHFQQYDRWIEHSLNRRVVALSPFSWGIREMRIDADALAVGQFRLVYLSAIMPDGTVIVLPEAAPEPPARAIGEAQQNKLVRLAVPVRATDAPDVADAVEADRRYVRHVQTIRDTSNADRPSQQIEVANLGVRILFEDEPEDDLVSLPLARVAAIEAGGAVSLSESFIPPAIIIGGSRNLQTIIAEVRTLLKSRADVLAGRADPARGLADGSSLFELMSLAAINRYATVLDHVATTPSLAPETVYTQLLGLAGELSTFVNETRRPPDLPAYRHDDLESTFVPMLDVLRRLLVVVSEERAVRIPLEAKNYGIWVGPITDRSIFQDRRFVLVVTADIASETIRSQFPIQLKVGPVEQIRDLVNLQLPGITIRSLPVAPREIPFLQDAVYFELDTTSDLWGRLPQSAAFSLHISGEYPGLRLELWAIQKGGR